MVVVVMVCVADPCESPQPCQHDSACIVNNQTGEYTCQCAAGYGGVHCQLGKTCSRPSDVLAAFIQRIFLGNFPPAKKLTVPPRKAAKLCAINFFPVGTLNYKYIMETLLMDNKHGIVFVIKQSKGFILMPKMHQNTFGGQAGSAQTCCGSYALPQTH